MELIFFLSEFLASESNASEFCLSELNIDYSDKGLRSIFMKYGMRSKTSRVSKNFKTKIVFVPQFRNLIQNLISALETNAISFIYLQVLKELQFSLAAVFFNSTFCRNSQTNAIS